MENRCRREHFHHEADIGIRATGPTLAAAYGAAGRALTAVITDIGRVRNLEQVDVEVEDEDRELLFVCYLNAIVYEMTTRNMLFRDFDIHITGSRLNGTLGGEPVDRARHQPAVEIKGATLTELKVCPMMEDGWCNA